MPDCGWRREWRDESLRPPGVNRGKGRGITKPPARKRKRRRA